MRLQTLNCGIHSFVWKFVKKFAESTYVYSYTYIFASVPLFHRNLQLHLRCSFLQLASICLNSEVNYDIENVKKRI